MLLYLLETQQIAGTVVGEANTDGVHQRKDHEQPHARDGREDVSVRVQLAVDEHQHRGRRQHQEQHGEHELALGIQRQDQVESHADQCSQCPPL